MDMFERLEQLARLDQLIRLKATGTPKQLAEKVGLSRRQLLRDIAQLREKGFPIEYCKHKLCYYYADVVKMNFEIIVGAEKLMTIKGGKSEMLELTMLTDHTPTRPQKPPRQQRIEKLKLTTPSPPTPSVT